MTIAVVEETLTNSHLMFVAIIYKVITTNYCVDLSSKNTTIASL